MFSLQVLRKIFFIFIWNTRTFARFPILPISLFQLKLSILPIFHAKFEISGQRICKSSDRNPKYKYKNPCAVKFRLRFAGSSRRVTPDVSSTRTPFAAWDLIYRADSLRDTTPLKDGGLPFHRWSTLTFRYLAKIFRRVTTDVRRKQR